MSVNADFAKILEEHKDDPKGKILIVKPGENCNRGFGIEVFNCFDKIQDYL